MQTCCILTDNSVQFDRLNFPGNDLVSILSFTVELLSLKSPIKTPTELGEFPSYATPNCHPTLLLPQVNEIKQILEQISRDFDEVLVIFSSDNLNNLVSTTHNLIQTFSRGKNIHLIDSQTTSAGLGFLVQRAAEMAANKVPVQRIEKSIRKAIPNVFSMIAVPSPSYLFYSGLLDRTFSDACEILNLIPVFHMEEGFLSPVLKLRNSKLLTENILEFLEEFDSISNAVLICPQKSDILDLKQIQNAVEQSSGDISLITHEPSIPFAALFGSNSIGFFLLED